jgi:hypothetical protein
MWSTTFVRAAFGRPTMALHELCHFCATYFLELGLAPADVAVQLGHTDGGALVMSTYGHPWRPAPSSPLGAGQHAVVPVTGMRGQPGAAMGYSVPEPPPVPTTMSPRADRRARRLDSARVRTWMALMLISHSRVGPTDWFILQRSCP